MDKISNFIENVNNIVQQAYNNYDYLFEILKELKKLTFSNIFLISLDGELLTSDYFDIETCKEISTETDTNIINFISKEYNGKKYIDKNFSNELKSIVEIKFNILLKDLSTNIYIKNEFETYFAIIIPVVANMERVATIVLYRKEEFTYEDLTACKIYTIISALTIKQINNTKMINETGQINIVKASISALSYSELEAALEVFKALNNLEGLVVAKKIADQTGITRSAIVNTLRKLESAGIVESRSLGVKGTYIKVKNPSLLDELNKFER